jgi:hypothetical protein
MFGLKGPASARGCERRISDARSRLVPSLRPVNPCLVRESLEFRLSPSTNLFYCEEPKLSEVSIPKAGMFVEGAEPLSPFNEHSCLEARNSGTFNSL